jgi:hypothetical protein
VGWVVHSFIIAAPSLVFDCAVRPIFHGVNLNNGDIAMTKSTFDDLFGSDETKSKDGVPIPMGYNAKDEEVIFWIAAVNNPKHTAAQRGHSKMLEATRRNSKRHDAVLAKVVATGILLKWQGVLDENGEVFEDTVKNKTKQLIKYPRLFQAVMEESMNEDNYMLEDDMTEVEAAKDSEKN